MADGECPWSVKQGFLDIKHDWLKEDLMPLWPSKPQPRVNPYRGGEETPGSIRYAFVAFEEGVPAYKFNQKQLEAQQSTKLLEFILEKVVIETGVLYDCALINLCEAGEPSSKLSAHLDNEPNFDHTRDIASISTTAFHTNPDNGREVVRRFFINQYPGPKQMMGTAVDVPLRNGDLLVGPLSTHLHGLRPQFKSNLPYCESIVITFRKLK
jgi:hypothetical protein